MRKILSLILVSLLCLSMLSVLVPKAMGWSLALHGKMARDTLMGLGWDDEQIGSIPWYADEVDITLPHCSSSNHRVGMFQAEFEEYGGEVCTFAGAEFSAWTHIDTARELYDAGNKEEAERHLGYAIHFIQDAVCPPHVFPFSEKLLHGEPHLGFELYTLNWYGTIWNDWQSLVRKAPAEPIESSEDLREKVVEAAQWANNTFQPPRCSYRRQDGVEIGELSWLDSSKISGWKMSDDDIGECMRKASSLVKGAAIWATALQRGVTENYVPTGCAFMNFEDGTDEEVIKSTIPGLKFTTTLGYDWVYGDIRTGKYNVYPYGHQGYECNGNFFAWLGPNMGQGRIDFVLGPASYFSVLTSTYSGLMIDAYDSDDNLIASSGWATDNLHTRTFTRVSIQKPGMAYVIVHDTGNYWLIDDIVTDAPTLGVDVSSESVKKIPHRIEISLIDGDWTTPDSKIGVYIYDISMRSADLIAELTPQVADNLVVSFTVVLKDRDGDGTVSEDEIRQNIQEQIPELMAKEYVKFLNEQINSLGLPSPPPDYGTNLFNQILDSMRSVYNVASAYAPYALAIVAIPATIATAAPLTTYGLGGFQPVMTGIYIPTHGLIGTDGEKMATMYSFGDLEIIDSEGRVVCKAFSQIPGARYIEEDLNDDGVPDDTIVLPAEVRMNYIIKVIPDETAQPTDTFTLSFGSLGISFCLVSELSFSEIPEYSYGLHSSPSPRDSIHPRTVLTVGDPKYIDSAENLYITSASTLKLIAEDNPGGTGLASTTYRIHGDTYDSGWIEYTEPFYLTGLNDGPYSIDYYSIDNMGNVEPTNTQPVVLDNTPPDITGTNFEGVALQDGVTLKASFWDLSKVASVTFSIQCAQGDIVASGSATPTPDEEWEWDFDTTLHPDGYYLAVVTATDILGNAGDTPIQFSIRNWACVELLPASESNKGGRTMPVKFSLRVRDAVDPAQPFVYNAELTIKIYEMVNPDNILWQTSTYGDTARDYRINSDNELYITNFQTLKQPKTYLVEIYRKDWLIGTFEFSTVK